MNDLTVIYYTANYISDYFANNVRKQLLKAIGKLPLISVSKKPMDFGENICVGDTERSAYNIYKQILIGAKAAKTKYVAMAEDDVLYHPSHFTDYRPADDMLGFNKNKWGIYTWSDPPIFSFKDRLNMTSLVAPRDLLVGTLEERFKKYPTSDSVSSKVLRVFGEPGRYDRHLGVKQCKREEWRSSFPNIVFTHETALSFDGLGKRKKLGDERKLELPYWGKAEDIVKLYKERI